MKENRCVNQLLCLSELSLRFKNTSLMEESCKAIDVTIKPRENKQSMNSRSEDADGKCSTQMNWIKLNFELSIAIERKKFPRGIRDEFAS